MADRHRISCIIPVYNAETFLAQAIESALAQSRPPDEIIVVDDGSTDGSAGIAKRYAGAVTCIHQPNGGPASARNRGLDLATGTLIGFLDADDWWHTEALERHLAHFATYPKSRLQVSLAHVEHVWEAGAEHLQDHYARRGIVDHMPGYILQASVMRREVFETVGPFDPNFVILEDADWFSRARHDGITMDMLAETLVYRRMHGQNLTVVRAAEGHASFPLLIKKKLERERRSVG
ncbi:MAG: glycosyltransferase [Pseudomonadota bacterium]|nr:glycosyltransferase [Pseudomonadota bacterium]